MTDNRRYSLVQYICSLLNNKIAMLVDSRSHCAFARLRRVLVDIVRDGVPGPERLARVSQTCLSRQPAVVQTRMRRIVILILVFTQGIISLLLFLA